MALYTQPKVAQLQLLEIPAHIKLERYRYRLTVKTPETKKSFDSGKKPFDKYKKTIQVNIAYDTAVTIVEIYLDDKLNKTIALKHFDKSESKISTFSLKSTTAQNSSTEKHIVQVNVEQGADVGWLLVKKEQTFDSLLRWVYKQVPTHSQLDIFRHANAHLSDLQDLNLNKKVKPGQIILITNKKSSPKLNEYKKLALEAEKTYQILCKDKNFDAIFYAENFELIQSYLTFAREAMVAKLEYSKTVAGHKEGYCEPITLNRKAETLNGIGIFSEKTKDSFDANNIKTVKENMLNQLTKEVNDLQKKYKLDVLDKNKGRSNSVLDKKFKVMNVKSYEKIANLTRKNFIMNHDNKNFSKILNNIVKDNINLRDHKFMGGLKMHSNSIMDVGRSTIALKTGQNIVLSLYVAESLTKVYGAYQTGDSDYTLKVTVNESLKISGGFIGGYYGATAGGAVGGVIAGGLVTLGTIASGGTLAIAIVGIGAITGGVAGGFWGTIGGDMIGNHYLEICK